MFSGDLKTEPVWQQNSCHKILIICGHSERHVQILVLLL